MFQSKISEIEARIGMNKRTILTFSCTNVVVGRLFPHGCAIIKGRAGFVYCVSRGTSSVSSVLRVRCRGICCRDLGGRNTEKGLSACVLRRILSRCPDGKTHGSGFSSCPCRRARCRAWPRQGKCFHTSYTAAYQNGLAWRCVGGVVH